MPTGDLETPSLQLHQWPFKAIKIRLPNKQGGATRGRLELLIFFLNTIFQAANP